SHCKPFYQSKYNNIGELKKVLRSEAKRKEAQKFFDNNLRDIIINHTSEKEDQIIKILERYVVLEKEEYTNNPDELGGSCISFKSSNKLEDNIKPKKFQEEYCASDRNAPLAKIQEEKDKVIITELREYEPKLQQLAGKKILNLLLKKPIFEEDLKGRKHCGIIKFSILPIQLKAILIEDEFNTIPEVKGVDENDNKGEFKFIILSEKYNWDYESDDQIELKGEGANISQLLSGEDMILNFGETFGIISVGTASCEGAKSSENKRAEKRAVTLDQWLNQAFRKYDDLKNTERYTLNLGQYKRKCLSKTEKTKQQTALQGRVIIIGITYRDKDVNLSQALRDAIIKRPDLSFDIKKYSSFDLKRSN
ncbi:MAG: hypothetical protein O4808_17420, partial [Trichodesmium sp. St17_bin3_1_1]|nr:hypothetical protein [Trichodesmium sp. St17_bin3_1_1]